MSFGLLPQHEALLRASGITPEVAQARGYVSVDTKMTLARFGFGKAARQVPGLLVPVHTVTGRVAFHQYRPDSPRLNTDGKPIRYETPHGATMALDVHPAIRDRLGTPACDLYLTEGIRKADAAVSRGLCCVALLGVWSWRGTNAHGGKTALADWEHVALNGRRVFIVFDSDVMTKAQVSAALTRLRGFLASRGAHVLMIYLPAGPTGEKDGLDDYLAAGHSVEALQALATEDLRTPTVPAPGREGFHLTDLGNAQRLAAWYGADLRYDHRRGCWRWWDGTRWAIDETGEAMRRAKAVVVRLYRDAADAPDETTRRALVAWALQSESAARLEAMLRLAESESPIAGPHAFDANPWLLNCPNGTVDLRTGILRPHRREDLFTKRTAAPYDAQARSALWEETLAKALPDPEVRAFHQKAAGYSTSGDTREDKLFVAVGPTGAMKTTVNEAKKAALGDYATTADFESFLRRRDVGTPRSDIARLDGARLVLSVEVEQGRKLAEALIKSLTGGDTISARRLYQEAFEFRPQLKLWLVCNHAPQVADDDDAIWRRIVRIPFETTLPPEARDPTVKLTLRDPQTHGAAVLAWLVAGCLAWQRDGLQPPAAVRQATAAYRAEMHPLADFFRDCCSFTRTAWTATAALRDEYEKWYRENGERPLAGRTFAARLRALGCTTEKQADIRGWNGISLTPSPETGNGPADSTDGNFDNFSPIRAREKVTDSAVCTVLLSGRHPSPAPPSEAEEEVTVPEVIHGVPREVWNGLPPLMQASADLFGATIVAVDGEPVRRIARAPEPLPADGRQAPDDARDASPAPPSGGDDEVTVP